MNRLPLLAAAGVLFAAPVSAQIGADSARTDRPAPTLSMPADSDTSMTDDSTMTVRVVDTDAAREFYREGLALAERAPTDTTAAAISRARSAFEGALGKYEQALEADPAFAPALYGRAQSLGRLGRFEESRRAYEATIAAAQGADLAYVREPAMVDLADVEAAIVQRDSLLAENAEIEASNASIETQTEAVEAASALLTEFPVSEENAQAGYEQLERARLAGYDADDLAFYYAKALNALGRGEEALPYAQQALAASDEADKSPYYIQIGIAQRFSANDPAAREAFEAAKSGSWASWADYYIAEMGAAPSDG